MLWGLCQNEWAVSWLHSLRQKPLFSKSRAGLLCRWWLSTVTWKTKLQDVLTLYKCSYSQPASRVSKDQLLQIHSSTQPSSWWPRDINLELNYTGLKGGHAYDIKWSCRRANVSEWQDNQLFLSIFEVRKTCCGCVVIVPFIVQKVFQTQPKGFEATGRCSGDWLDLVHFTVLSGEVITTLVEVEEAAWPEAREWPALLCFTIFSPATSPFITILHRYHSIQVKDFRM